MMADHPFTQDEAMKAALSATRPDYPRLLPLQSNGKRQGFDWRAKDQRASDLHGRDIVVRPGLVNRYIPQGYTVLGGRPKSGKSVLALQVALAVSSDSGFVFGQTVLHGTVLYIALEDNELRMQSRLTQMVGRDEQLNPLPFPSRLHLFYQWPTFDQGGLDYLDEFVAEYPDTALVVIDTAPLFRGPVPRGGGYDADYTYSHALGDWANRKQTSLLGVTHTNKRHVDDGGDTEPLDAIQNTTGITAAADTVLVMARNEGVMTMYRRGRDLDETDPVKMRMDGESLLWVPDQTLAPMAARDVILDVLRLVNFPMPPNMLAQYSGLKGGTVRQALLRMLAENPAPVGTTKAGYYLRERGPSNDPNPEAKDE